MRTLWIPACAGMTATSLSSADAMCPPGGGPPPLNDDLRSLFAEREFLRLWAGRILSGAATQMLMVAAAWQMYELTNSAWDLGLVGLLQFLPVLLFTLPSGHVADRYHRGRIIAITQA